jgi:hypothetical protein
MNKLRNFFTSKTQKRNLHVHVIKNAKDYDHVVSTNMRTVKFWSFLCFVVGPLWMIYTGKEGNPRQVKEIWDPQPDFMRIRLKPYPWFCYDCNLFDGPCQRICKAEEKERKKVWDNYQKNKK